MNFTFVALGLIPIFFASYNAAAGNEDTHSFACDFYQKIEKPSSVIVSTFSISTALAFLAQGAQKTTFDQIAHGLHFGNDKTAIAANYVQQITALNERIGAASFSIANKIYVKHGASVKKSFKDVAVNKFNSDIETINFADNVAATTTINKYVEEKTNDKIKNLIDSDSVNADTAMVLVNAIHFKAEWEKPFEPYNTYDGDFYLDETKTVKVKYMKKASTYRYGVFDDLASSTVELKYKNSHISFLVFLPHSKTGLSALEAATHNYDFSQVSSQLKHEHVDVVLPKFKIEFEIDLKEALQGLGMTHMFDDGADFSDIFDSPQPLKVSKAIHKAFIEIDENGTEAAAATAVLMVVGSSMHTSQNVKEFHADHPFLFFIVDTERNTILFHGRFKN